MGRVKLLMVIGGGVLCFFGIKEFRVSMGTASDPVAVVLKDLEDGKELPNNYIKLDTHYAAHHETVYYGEEGSTNIDYSYHPILSSSHPFVKKLDDYFKNAGSDGIVPPNVPEPEIEKFAVLVKTKKYKTVAQIPQSGPADAVKGLVINSIKSLSGDEKKLIKQSFPALDIDKVLILEQDREPASGMKSWGMIIGGIIICLGGIGWFFVGAGEGA